MKKLSIIIPILFLISFSSIIWNLQREMIFHPVHDPAAYYELSENEKFKKVEIDNLCGWMRIQDKTKKQPLIIMFGGNQQNSSNTFYHYELDETFKYFNGYNVLMVDYPRYGTSKGKLSDKTVLDSALKVYDYACDLDCVDKDKIVIMGYSLGTSPATYLASKRDVIGLILAAPFDNSYNLYNNYIPIFKGPGKLLIRYHFDSSEYAKNVKIKPLVIASKDDEIVPYALSSNLVKSFKEAEFMTIDKAGHNDILCHGDVWEEIQDYLNNLKE